MARATNGNYYTNPAFCHQSEFYNYHNKSLHKSQISLRQPPVGAQTTHKILDNSVVIDPNDSYEEQDFYEEMLVDDTTGTIREKKIVVVSQNLNDNSKRYVHSQQNLHQREAEVTYIASEEKMAKKRYEYIPMTEHTSPTRYQNKNKNSERIEETTSHNISRYAVIDVEEEPGNKGRYALVPLEDLNQRTCKLQRAPSQLKSTPNLHHRYEYIDDPPDYNEIQNLRHNSPPRNSTNTRYEYIQQQTPTQKLHEILSTPRRTPQKILSPYKDQKTPSNPFVTPQKPTPKKILTPMKTPKAQQKLNYSIGSRQNTPSNGKRNTAIVAPICSSPVQSLYSENTFSNKTESWMNLSTSKPPIQATLAVAALMMFVCGGLSSGMCFYMMSLIGKVYYLEFGIVSGFACLTLGVLGFRTRYCHWLPNRNYISGYIVLSVFSLLTCAALLILLFMQPRPGTPLADMTSGAVSGISVLSLCLAATGVVSSYCCSYPPPDNRVQHCAQGFTV